MTGFIRNLFGSRRPLPGEDEQPQEQQVQPRQAAKPQSKEAYFLKPDDAKTMGDIDYMRTSKTIRRTFPKVRGGAGKEIVSQVSSEEMSQVDKFGVAQSQTKSAAQQPQESSPSLPKSTPKRRNTDTSMDMFRNMARDLKK